MDRPARRSRTWIMAVSILGALVLALMVMGFDSPAVARAAVGLSLVIATLVTTWSLVRTRTERHRYENQLASWAAERAIQAERLRIARDLHDLASHGLGAITLRAASALAVSGPHREAERDLALADIEATSRQATTELRRMLTVLREPGGAPLRAPETMDDLPAIIGAARAGGLTITDETERLDDLSAGVQVAICAIVREALHNTRRHAGPTAVTLHLSRESAIVTVDITDRGPVQGWDPPRGAGHGLDGLRERVHALDGSLQAGPVASGWRLSARIPDPGAR